MTRMTAIISWFRVWILKEICLPCQIIYNDRSTIFSKMKLHLGHFRKKLF